MNLKKILFHENKLRGGAEGRPPGIALAIPGVPQRQDPVSTLLSRTFFKFIFFIFLCSVNVCYASNKPLTLVLDWFANPDHAPLFVAQEQGFFKKAGIAVNIINPADPNDAPKLVAAGKADLGITYQPQLVEQVTQGLPLVRIATLINKPLNCLAVNASSAIQSIADLKGKTIAYSGDEIDKAFLSVMLSKKDLTLKDVQLVDVNYSLTPALLTGKVDAAMGMMRNVELLQMEQAGKPARAFYVEKNGIPLYDELVIITNKSEVRDPRLPLFLMALQEGVHFLVTHPEQSWQLFAKAHPELNNTLNHAIWQTTVSYFSLDPAQLDVRRYQNLAGFLKQQNLIKTIPLLKTYAIELRHPN